MEQTFVIIKPDAVASGHVGAILQRYEQAGLRFDALEQRTITAEDSLIGTMQSTSIATTTRRYAPL